MKTTPYTNIIAASANGFDPRHIEAFIRVQYGTLDHLSKSKFSSEIKIAKECIEVGGVANAESVAQSFGL